MEAQERPGERAMRWHFLKDLKAKMRGGCGKRADAGFTLTEALAATAVLVLSTALVASGVALANRSYEQQQFESEANVLSGTINNALADACRFATPAITGDAQNGPQPASITFDAGLGDVYTVTAPQLKDIAGKLYLQCGNGGDIRGGDGNSHKEQFSTSGIPLINSGAYGDGEHGACEVSNAKMEFNGAEVPNEWIADISYTISSASKNADGTPKHSHDYQVKYRLNLGASHDDQWESNGSADEPDTPEIDDSSAPKDGDHPSDKGDGHLEKQYALPAFNSSTWNVDHSVWTAKVDGNGTSYLALKADYGDVYGLVYYLGHYYRPRRAGGSDYYSVPLPEPPASSNPQNEVFTVGHLTDSGSHRYGYDPVTWEVCS